MPKDLVDVARGAIAAYLRDGRVPVPPDQPGDPAPAGVFVSLHEQPTPPETEGPLRGCIGTVDNATGGLRSEVARSAVAAATSDPRFPPLAGGEVDSLDVTIYVLHAPEPVDDIAELDPVRFGVIVRDRAGRTGLLLPGIPGIEDARIQVDIARRKAGIPRDEPVELNRFEADILT